MIVDFRTRPPFKSWKKLRIWGERPKNPDPVTASGLFQNIEPYRSYEEKSMDAFMEEMDEAACRTARFLKTGPCRRLPVQRRTKRHV